MRRRSGFTFFIFSGLAVLLWSFFWVVVAQQPTCLAEVATGKGTLTLHGGERLSINAIAVLLRKNGEAEICLMTPRDNFDAAGRWSGGAFAGGTVHLAVTADTEGGRLTGRGVLFLKEGCIPVDRLTMRMSKSDGSSFEVEFVAENAPCSKAGRRLARLPQHPDQPMTLSLLFWAGLSIIAYRSLQI